MRLRNVPFGRQRIDAEFGLLLGEGLFFSVVTLCLPIIAWWWPTAVLQWLLLDQAIVLALALTCAAVMKRPDILICVFAFPFLRVLNSAILLRTFWLEIVRRQRTLEWFTVARYDATTLPGHHHGASKLSGRSNA